ncbi:MAG: O-antigen ligase family protein [Acidimicrobiales bacterium]
MTELDRAAVVVSVGILTLFGLPIGGPARVFAGVVLALEFVVAVLLKPTWWPKGRLDRSSAVWLGALGIWLLLTGLMGKDPAATVSWLVAYAALGWLGTLVVALLGEHRAPGVLVAGLSLPTLIALASIAGPLIVDRVFDVADRAVISGDLAALAATLLALVVYFDPALYRVPPWARRATALGAVVIVAAAASRSVMLAATAAVAFGLWRTGRGAAVARLTIAAIVVGVLTVAAFGLGFGSLVDSLSSDLGDGGGRDALWDAGIAAVRDRPLLGYGLANHGDVLAEYRLTSHFAVQTETQSMLLFAALAGGLPAVALMLGSIIMVARNATEPQRVLIVAVVVFGLGDSPFEVLGVTTFMIGIMAVAHSSSELSTSDDSKPWGIEGSGGDTGWRDDLSV